MTEHVCSPSFSRSREEKHLLSVSSNRCLLCNCISFIIFTPPGTSPSFASLESTSNSILFLIGNRSHIALLKETDHLTILHYWFAASGYRVNRLNARAAVINP